MGEQTIWMNLTNIPLRRRIGLALAILLGRTVGFTGSVHVPPARADA